MPVNSGLAQVSNELLFGTVIVYAIAMLCYACDFAFGKQRVLAVAPVSELVSAGAPAGTGVVGVGPAAGGPAAGRSVAGGPAAGGRRLGARQQAGGRPDSGCGWLSASPALA